MKLTDPIKSALATSAWSFIGSVALLSVGWIQQLAKWASTNGHTPLPGLSVVGYALIGAAVSAASGIVTFVVRFAQQKNVLPGTAPAFAAGIVAGTTPPPPGAAPAQPAGEPAAVPIAHPWLPRAPDPLIAEIQKRRDDWLAIRDALAPLADPPGEPPA